MIHYTPLTEYDIYEDDESSYDNYQIVEIEGKSMKVMKTEDGSYQLLQLLSTDPQDYLNSNYSPGTILSNLPEQS